MSLPCGIRNHNYAQDMAIFRTGTHWTMLVCFLAVLFTVPPLMFNHLWLNTVNSIGITLIATLGLNILVGYCGQLSIGHAGFIAVGAYTSAILTNRFGMPFPVGLISAGVVAGVIGIIFGLPSVRVKGFYLAITTIAAQFIIIWVINHWGLTGGFEGISVPYASIGGLVFDTDVKQFYLVMVIVVMAVFFAKNLVRTKVGRAFIAIRDNDLAAEVMGINVNYYKLLAFFIGCFFAGIAGALLAHTTYTLNAEQFSFTDSILYIGMIIVGGLGTTVGPILGVGLIKIIQKVLLPIYLVPWLGNTFTNFPAGFASGVAPMVFGLIIVLFLILEPRGLAHRWNLFKAAYRLWPFSY
jgi:branched-chain amino acid transport system permease protein